MVLYKRKFFIQNQDHIWSRYHSGNWISRSWKKEKTRIFRNLRRRIHDPVFEFFTVFLWTVISIGEIWFCWTKYIFFVWPLEYVGLSNSFLNILLKNETFLFFLWSFWDWHQNKHQMNPENERFCKKTPIETIPDACAEWSFCDSVQLLICPRIKSKIFKNHPKKENNALNMLKLTAKW